MADYFTSDHFNLLNKWKGQKRDESNPEQKRAYQALSEAYAVTEAWAREVQTQLFPQGMVRIRKRPTNQGNNFSHYNWARIYPHPDAPKALAYTVGIESDLGFVVKIDTVGLDELDPVRRKFLALRGPFNNTSPIVAALSSTDGLSKSADELVAWSIAAIGGFGMTYDEVAARLELDRANYADTDDTDRVEDDMPEPSASLPINRIYYGPPGTGKTYALTELLKRDYERSMTSVSPNEWRKQLIAENISTLTWWEGIAAALYDLGGHSKVGELLDHEFIQAIGRSKGRSKNVRNTLWRMLQAHAVLDSETVNVGDRTAPAIFDKSKDSTWSFAGDWRESCADVVALVDQLKDGPPRDKTVHKRYSFVTFHQSYGYEEFVEGLRPILSDDVEAGSIAYEIRPGIFKELCNRARISPDQRFAMVIDEINRGNISKVFGELITLIEADKRDGAEHTVSVTLPYSGESFSVPPNVDIIGTMNTADRSLALLDTALRRRFDFVAVMPDARDESDAPLQGLRVTSGDLTINVPQMLAAINQRVEALYDRDHTIGHAYFTGLKFVPDGETRMAKLGEVFRNRVVPLLEEYFFEDWNKIRLVLADNQKAGPARFIIETNDRIDDLALLFGDDHGLDTYTTKCRYAVQSSAFSNPEAYVGIYQSLMT